MVIHLGLVQYGGRRHEGIEQNAALQDFSRRDQVHRD